MLKYGGFIMRKVAMYAALMSHNTTEQTYKQNMPKNQRLKLEPQDIDVSIQVEL